MPSFPEWRSLERRAELDARLIDYAQSLDISVEEEVLRGVMQGYSTPGRVVRAPSAGTKTLVHEIAHELLHQRSLLPLKSPIRPDRQTCEAEAESVAYIVCRHFGFEGLHSPVYLVAHGVDGALLKTRMEQITMCARQLIDAVESVARVTPDECSGRATADLTQTAIPDPSNDAEFSLVERFYQRHSDLSHLIALLRPRANANRRHQVTWLTADPSEALFHLSCVPVTSRTRFFCRPCTLGCGPNFVPLISAVCTLVSASTCPGS